MNASVHFCVQNIIEVKNWILLCYRPGIIRQYIRLCTVNASLRSGVQNNIIEVKDRISLCHHPSISCNMSTASAGNRSRALKCRHFCNPWDLHNYCPTCRESSKGDDYCITGKGQCMVCASFTEEQKQKIASEMPVPHSLGKYFQHHEI